MMVTDDRLVQGRDLLQLAMGPAGLVSRVLAARLGNRWTYAGPGVAPGQVSMDRMRRHFQFSRIQPGAALHRQLADHLSLTELPRMRFNVCGTLAREIHFSFSERVQRERGHVSRQPGHTPA